MKSAFSLDKVFYEQINEKMTSLGYKYIRKYKMFMKVTGNMLLKYLYIERFSMINREMLDRCMPIHLRKKVWW